MANDDERRSSLEDKIECVKLDCSALPEYSPGHPDYKLQESYRQYILGILRKGGEGS